MIVSIYSSGGIIKAEILTTYKEMNTNQLLAIAKSADNNYVGVIYKLQFVDFNNP